MDPSGEVLEQITDLPEGACQPSWSPDGSKLVFVSPCAGPAVISQTPPKNTSLYVIDVEGSNLTPLTNTPGGDFEPAWSPDGTHIAFTSFRDGTMQVYSLNLADQSAARLTNLAAGAEARQPAWSNSGSEILFTVRRVGAFQIWVMSATGENARQLIRSGQDYWDYFPAWSRDGISVLFSQRQTGGSGPVWQMSSRYDGSTASAASRLNMGKLPVEHISVSPDGFWIAFQGEEVGGNLDLFFLTVTGAERTRLTSDAARDFDPAWRPILPLNTSTTAASATPTP
jgi:Tol biopolymer transport system component